MGGAGRTCPGIARRPWNYPLPTGKLLEPLDRRDAQAENALPTAALGAPRNESGLAD
ncbi:hypothetical protein KR51_00003410 [Rubidibacter lacunae KORDI 51-2]|uniref:Uncharacterized protein n=1 Tax=Rubidibacter lacunae KORDI 51-2 TaxID=582515 RepID=U5DTM4_9CHRO|nr:hypothetical protein KR51_00003410 [Rubidibacter lacunae KORDI 51-2]